MNSEILDIKYIHIGHAIAEKDQKVLDLFFELINDFVQSETSNLEKRPSIHIKNGKVVFVTRISEDLTPERTFPFKSIHSDKENSRSLQLAVRNTLKSFGCKFEEEEDCISLQHRDKTYKIQF